jgi:hypothetical protein
MSLDASAPHRIIHGASAVGARCRQRAQITQSHGVTRRRSARVAIGVVGIRLIAAGWAGLHQSESHEA